MVQEAGGRVMIGFKPPAAARTSETGIVPGIELMVKVEDGQQNLMYGTLEVTIDPNAPECFDSLMGVGG